MPVYSSHVAVAFRRLQEALCGGQDDRLEVFHRA